MANLKETTKGKRSTDDDEEDEDESDESDEEQHDTEVDGGADQQVRVCL